MKDKKDKGFLIIMLCIVVIVMSVAFAAFSTNLNINGTTTIASTWKIAFDANYSSCDDGSAVTVNGNTATLSVALEKPGDEVTCTITVKNSGTLDAKLSSITATPSGTAPITFTVTPTNTDLATREVLVKNGGTETIKVVVAYDSDVEGQPDDITNTLTVTANYVQHLGA